MNLRILFVEDSPDDAEFMLSRLRKAGIEPQWERVQTEDALREALAGEHWQLALVDFNLPSFSGPEALALLAALAPDVPAITVSGAISEETAVATISAGAVDYILKGNLTRLAPAVLRAVEGAELRARQRRAAAQARQTQFAIDHSSQAIFYVSEGGTVLYANEAAERLGGASPADVVGQKIWAWSHLVDEQRWAELWRAAAQAPIVDFEAAVRLSGGEERLISATLDYHERDEDAFVIVYARDVTAQREAEERAQASEERYNRMADNAPDILFRYDLLPTAHLTYINRAVEAITGHSPEEHYADPQLLLDIIDPRDVELVRRMIKSPPLAHEPVLMRWNGKDGVTRWMESRLVAVFDSEGRLQAVEGITRDVTERVEAGEAFRQSEAELRTLINTLPDLVWLKDPEGVYLSCNRRFESYFGTAEKNIAGKTDYDFVERSLADFCRQRDESAMVAEDATVNEEEIVFAEDGHSEVLETITTPVRASDGRLIGVLGVGRDITERKRAEEALRKSEERLRRVSAATSDFAYSCVKPPGGSFTFDWLTGAVERITGWSRDELLAWGCWKDLVLEEDRPLFNERVTGLVPGASSVCALRIRDKQGGVRWLAVYNGAERDAEDPAVHRLYGACQDITERKQADEALRESEERFEEFAAHFPGHLFMHDEERRYVYVNRPDEKDGDILRGDWLGKTPSQVWEGDYAPRAEARIQRALQGEVIHFEELWTPPGVSEYLHTIYFPMPHLGKPPLVGGLSIDVTAQHEAEEEVRRQAQQLRRTVEGAVLALSLVVETRDPYTAGHERRVSELATAIAADMGMAGEALEALRLGGLIHDVGKIAVPAEILSKPGRLSEIEFNLIKQHPAAGFEILGAIDFGLPVAEMVLQHHERLDGSGYPKGLAGKDVLPEARILAVADVVEAMSSHRPYRAALGMAAALEEVRAHAGVKYDAEVVASCVRLVEEQGFAFTP